MPGRALYFSRKTGLAAFMAAGPLAPVLDELVAGLEAAGYCQSTIRGYARCARHVTYALEHRQLARRQVTLAGLREFARVHHRSCRCPRPEQSSASNFLSCMAHLLPILQRRRLAAASSPARPPFEELLREFDRHMDEVRGASEQTRELVVRSAARALAALMPRGRFDPGRLTRESLQAYIVADAERHAPSSVARLVVSLRALLRFLVARGHHVADPTELMGVRRPRYRPSGKSLTGAQLRALLAPLRRSREPTAVRDLAILLLLAQVGLRRSEVARLQLRDFDARGGKLRIQRSKSRRAFELPVPADARDAVLRYVRHVRPEVESRALFLGQGFPYDRGITSHSVGSAVTRAFRRAGMQHVSHGAHVLRHTLATQLVAAHQPLKSVADILRHKEIDTTAVYVHVDLERLRAAARPWPRE